MSGMMSEPQIITTLGSHAANSVDILESPAARTSVRTMLSFIRGRSIVASAPLLAANVIEALVALLRNIALAHLIAPKEFGLAISLSAVIGILEVLTDFGLPVYAVRKSINLPDQIVMATVQSLVILRAAFLATILFAIAPFIANLFGATHDRSAYFMLGLIVLLGGFENFGVKAMTRDFRFGREAAVVVLKHLSGLAVTVVLAYYLRSFACVLWGMAALTFVGVSLSHALSPSPYRIGWNREAAKDMASFGAPLLLNGLAVAFSLSDRILIGGVLNPSSLAFYNVAVGTAQSPRCIAVKFLTSAFLPAFVRTRFTPGSTRTLFDGWAWLVSAIAFLYGFILAICGSEMLNLVFGAAYVPSRDFMALTAMLISVSFLMHVPVPPAYASGDTKIITYGSFIYAIATLPALGILLMSRSLPCFMLTLSLSELLGLAVLLRIACRRQPFSSSCLWSAVLLPYGLLAVLAATSYAAPAISEARWLLVCGTVFAMAAATYATGNYQATIGGSDFIGSCFAFCVWRGRCVMTIYLVTTSDIKGNRKSDLLRLHQTVEGSAVAASERVKMALLLQNCTAEECEAYRKIVPECCSVVSIPGSCSLSAARNLLLRAIQSETPLLDHDIVGFPDDDCWFPVNFIPCLSLAFRERAGLEVLFCRSSFHPDQDEFSPDEMVTATIPQIVRLSSSNNVFYRGSVIRSVGLFDPDLGLGTPIGGSEDTDYIIRCALAVGACSFIDRRLVGHAEPSRASAVKYFRGSLVVLTRYADRQPRLLLEFLRKICVGFVFAMQGSISFKFLVGSFVLGVKKRAFVAERIGS